MRKDRLSREERDLLRGQVDQAKREAQRPSAEQSPADNADEIAAFLASHPARHYSMSEISRALNYGYRQVKRALESLEDQQRATTIRVGRFKRWRAFVGRT